MSAVECVAQSLDARRRVAYIGHVADTSAIGCENPESVGGQPPQCGIFYVRLRSRTFNYGGPGRAAARLTGANCRFLTPASACRPHVRMNGGPQLHQLEASMHQSSCLTRSSEQTRSLNPHKQAALALIRAAARSGARSALRAATDTEAADVAYQALLDVYALTRAEQGPALKLPAVGQRLLGGWFVGLNRRSQLVILLPDDLEAVNFHEATEWVRSIGGDLPTRAELSLLFANFPRAFAKRIYWSCERQADTYAWYGSFVTGRQYYCLQRRPIHARAIRRVSLDAFLALNSSPTTIQSDWQAPLNAVMRAEVAHG